MRQPNCPRDYTMCIETGKTTRTAAQGGAALFLLLTSLGFLGEELSKESLIYQPTILPCALRSKNVIRPRAR
eukprot:3693704-Pyramimonas_sp.AAC.1